MTGILLGARLQRKDIVGLAYIGDGGASTGAFYEGMNFAAVQKLPLVVIVEHNKYAYSTPTSMQTALGIWLRKPRPSEFPVTSSMATM
jgi:pyruvate dehydrogenase E1 component alpha subunit/2-oxoisovalerate dehydrogenase E1 component alpha subunit